MNNTADCSDWLSVHILHDVSGLPRQYEYLYYAEQNCTVCLMIGRSLLDVACNDSQSVVQEGALKALRTMAAQPLLKHVSDGLQHYNKIRYK